MCGLFCIIGMDAVKQLDVKQLVKLTERRGSDASGLIYNSSETIEVCRFNGGITKLWKNSRASILEANPSIMLGHSRLMTNGYSDNQPIIRDDIAVLHNGIITNSEVVWGGLKAEPQQEVDSEVLAGLALESVEANSDLNNFSKVLDAQLLGSVSTIIFFKNLQKLFLYTNNGSLYYGTKSACTVVASEAFTLKKLGVSNIHQVKSYKIIDLTDTMITGNWRINSDDKNLNLIPSLVYNKSNADKLIYQDNDLRRCTSCILPETMPFIHFNENGICNYCLHYKRKNEPKPICDFVELLERYRKSYGAECIVPFSGGRDSSFGLHLITKELGLRAITYTYDWGMVTDLARRNISKMCSDLNVENILIAADIRKKRQHIKKNLETWLKKPDLGMVSILTAGDKHFFKWIENIKRETEINLNIWSVNPLEVTHFKAGFLGIPPKFMNEKVYNSGWKSQIDYHQKRFGRMVRNPGYFNTSLFDTLSGEYYRSLLPKHDYYHLFDYWKWNESEIDATLETYGWETATDTHSTWRIGDGTAAFYNYVYYTMAGFTEHDTFRSNQIREGDITRSEAMDLVIDENRPRYENIKWYLDVVGVEFSSAIDVVNASALKL